MIPAIGSAYSRFQTNLVSPTSGPAAASASVTNGMSGGGAVGADFSSVLSQVAGDAMNTVKNAESISIKGVNGQASTQAVVDAVMAAERTLQTAVSLRDKAVGAYTELSRMSM